MAEIEAERKDERQVQSIYVIEKRMLT